MAVIQDLPPEVVARVFSFLPDFEGMSRVKVIAAALVCKAWTPLAEEELRRELYFVVEEQDEQDGPSRISKFIASKGSQQKMRTETVCISYSTGQAEPEEQEEQLYLLLRHCWGVRNLQLDNWYEDGNPGISVKKLQVEALSRLRFLHLGDVKFSPPDTTPLNFAFHLTKLSISISDDLPLPLFAAFLQPTVESLILKFSSPFDDSIHAEEYLQMVEAHAPYVKSLEINGGENLPAWLGLNDSPRIFRQRANAFFGSFSGIRYLKCGLCDFKKWGFLSNWPKSLETLDIWSRVPEDPADLANLLRRVGEAMREVKTLKQIWLVYWGGRSKDEYELVREMVEESLDKVTVVWRLAKIGYEVKFGSELIDKWSPSDDADSSAESNTE